MADEYIKREEAKAAIQQALCDGTGYGEALNAIPAADVRPVVRGRWIEDGSGYQTCSNCGEEHHWLDYRADFCDACGADMREATT